MEKNAANLSSSEKSMTRIGRVINLFFFGRRIGLFCLIIFTFHHFCCTTDRQKDTDALREGDSTQTAKVDDPTIAFGDSALLSDGKSKYDMFCVQCHGQFGEGLIGPNLTDDYWLHGNDLNDVTRIIKDGVPEKGMLAWAQIMSTQEINQVALYVKSFSGEKVPNPKAPEGKRYSPDGVEVSGEIWKAPNDAVLAGLPMNGDAAKGQKLFNGTFGCAHCHGQDISNVTDNRDLKRMRNRYGPRSGIGL